MDKGIQIFEVAHFFFEKKVAEIAKKPRGGGFTDWTHYDHGNHVYWTIGKTGSYEDAQGTKRDSKEFTAFQLLQRETPQIPDHILEQSFALDEIIKMHPSDEEVSMAFFGSTTVPDDGPTQEEQERLPKKTALERAREQAKAKTEEEKKPVETKPRLPVKPKLVPKTKPEPKPEPEHDPAEDVEASEEEEAILVEGLVCEQCGNEVYDTPAGRTCAFGHGGIEGVVPEEPDAPPVKQTKTKPKKQVATDLACPAAELGGVFGESIEQLDECDDCAIWEACSDANDVISKAAKKEAGDSKLVRR